MHCTALTRSLTHSITQAFRKLSLKYHPDRNADNSDKFVEINEAHEVCSV
jgi:curved DNA-binding protein CbpA